MSETNSSIVKLSNVTKTFKTPTGDLVILENVNLEVKRGEKVAIVGPSGSGKSTLLSLLGLLDTESSGEILIDNIKTASLSEDNLAKLRNEKIGFVFQDFELINPFTVSENVAVPVEISHMSKSEVKAGVSELIDKVGMSHRAEALPKTLSGGEKQRVAIARALINKPDLILADEPTGSLDRENGQKVLDLLLSSVTEGKKALIIITHDEAIAARMDRVFEIKNKSLHERS